MSCAWFVRQQKKVLYTFFLLLRRVLNTHCAGDVLAREASVLSLSRIWLIVFNNKKTFNFKKKIINKNVTSNFNNNYICGIQELMPNYLTSNANFDFWCFTERLILPSIYWWCDSQPNAMWQYYIYIFAALYCCWGAKTVYTHVCVR